MNGLYSKRHTFLNCHRRMILQCGERCRGYEQLNQFLKKMQSLLSQLNGMVKLITFQANLLIYPIIFFLQYDECTTKEYTLTRPIVKYSRPCHDNPVHHVCNNNSRCLYCPGSRSVNETRILLVSCFVLANTNFNHKKSWFVTRWLLIRVIATERQYMIAPVKDVYVQLRNSG